MRALAWIDGGSYRVAAKTADGAYLILMSVGGSRGPLYRTEYQVGFALGHKLGEVRDTIAAAKADAQLHHDEQLRQAHAAAKDPTE